MGGLTARRVFPLGRYTVNALRQPLVYQNYLNRCYAQKFVSTFQSMRTVKVSLSEGNASLGYQRGSTACH